MTVKDWTTIQSDIIADHHINKPHPIRVIVLGAGISGIAFVYKAKKLENVTFTLYEKNPEVGGTWYAGGQEIQKFYQKLAKQYEVYNYTKFRHVIRKAEWVDRENCWHITVEDLESGQTFVDCAEVFINCGGVLNNWKLPAIEGLDTFKGPVVHSAAWDESLVVKERKVAVIGSGASAIQIVPTIQPDVKSLVSFNRSPHWIAGEFAGQLAADGRATQFSDEDRERFRRDPVYFKKFREDNEHAMNARFPVFYKNSRTQQNILQIVDKNMRTRLNHDPILCERLIPQFPVGCRRITPGHGYLEALTSSKVTVETDPIERIVEEGIITKSGKLHEVEVIIAATGFDTTYIPRFPIMGVNGTNLQDLWADQGPEAYLSLTSPKMPNYFATMGPNMPISNGSLIPAIERVLDYAITFIKKIQREDLAYVVVTEEATREFNDWKDEFMQGMTWSGGCTSWYKNGTSQAKVLGPWPGSVYHFMEVIKQPRFEDFAYKHKSRNRFRYLGDGRSTAEAMDKSLGSHVT